MDKCFKCKKKLNETGVAVKWFTCIIQNRIRRICKECMHKYALWEYWVHFS
jgi:hypothetical protein